MRELDRYDIQAVLDLKMDDGPCGYCSVREYLKSLLWELWQEGEGFSGKRPFGDSAWEYDLYQVLVQNNIVMGSLDENGYISMDKDFDKATAHKIIGECIKALK